MDTDRYNLLKNIKKNSGLWIGRAWLARLYRGLVLAVGLLISLPGLAADHYLTLHINGVPYYAALQENRQLLAQIRTSLNNHNATHFRGHLTGYPETVVRVSYARNVWRGLVILDGRVHRIEQFAEGAVLPNTITTLRARALVGESDHNATCAALAPPGERPAQIASTVNTLVSAGSPLASTTPCNNPVGGLCLLPHIELVYDQSYQNLPDLGLTPTERAVADINEMEAFFETDFGYRFSQLSLTMLTPVQDAGFSNSLNPYTLLRDIQTQRKNGVLDSLLQSRSSILHFVTGRDFSPVDEDENIDLVNGVNVVGLANLEVVCRLDGSSVGITDAGDSAVGNVASLAQSLVSRVIAHEIGHNMGAGHDSDDNSCTAGINLMSPSISGGLSGFSSCSVNEISNFFNPLATPACVDYPIDLSIQDDIDNPAEPPRNENFEVIYNLGLQRRDSSGLSSQVAITGEIDDPASGLFLQVSAAGANNCVIAGDGLSYQCTISNAPASFDLVINMAIDENATEFEADHELFSLRDNLVDVVAGNNAVNQFYNTFGQTGGGITQPSPGSSNGGGSGSSGGGGGGSVGIGLLALLLSRGLVRRFSRACC